MPTTEAKVIPLNNEAYAETEIDFDHLLKMANKGDAESQYRLSKHYSTKRDEKSAMHWLEKAVKQNHRKASLRMSHIVIQIHFHLKKDAKESEKFKLELEQHHPTQALDFRAYCYEKGIDVEQDIDKAIEMYKKSVKHHNSELAKDKLVSFGCNYLDGKNDMPIDAKKALDCFAVAAENGHPHAHTQMGLFYQESRGGIQNDQKAVVWFKKAAKLGDPFAQRNLGARYLAGKGVRANIRKAAGWLEKATLQNDIKAKALLCKLYKDNLFVTIRYETFAIQTDMLMRRHAPLNYPQALALMVPEVHAWSLHGLVLCNFPKPIFDLMFSFFCYLSAKEVRNLHIISVKDALEVKLSEREGGCCCFIADEGPYDELIQKCREIELTTAFDTARRMVVLLGNEIKREEQLNRTKKPLYKVCTAYLPFFQHIEKDNADVNHGSGNKLSTQTFNR